MKNIILVLVILLFSVSAYASSVMNVHWDNIKNVDIIYNSVGKRVGTTQFDLKFDLDKNSTWDLNTFGYCVDLDGKIQNNKNYTVNLNSNNGYKKASWLIDTYGDKARTNQLKQASLQLSIWKSIYNHNFSYNPKGSIGNFYTKYMNELSNNYSENLKYDYMIAEHDNCDYQSVITRVAPVPIPSSLFLLTSSLVCILGIRRRY